MKAIILVKFTSLETRDAYHYLKSLKPVVESFMVYGRFDAVAFIEADTLEKIRHILLSEIQPIPGIVEVLPCIIVENEIQTCSEPKGHPLKPPI